MARDLGRFLARWNDFKDLSVGIELIEDGGQLMARMTFSATKDNRRKTCRLNIDLQDSLQHFAGTLPKEGEKPIEAPIAVSAVEDAPKQ